MFGFMRVAFVNLVILYRVCHEWTLLCSICADCRSFLLSSIRSCHNVWHINGCWCDQHDVCHLRDMSLFTFLRLYPTPVLTGSWCSDFSFLLWTIVYHLCFLFLTFVLRYVGSGCTNIVLRLSLCLLGLKLSLYVVLILYFEVTCILIRLQQSNRANSTTWRDLLLCKYQYPSSIQSRNLQNMNMLSHLCFFIFSESVWDVIM